MKKIIILFLLVQISTLVILPIEYHPYNEYNETSISKILYSVIAGEVYTILEIGSNSDKAYFNLRFDDNIFYCSSDNFYRVSRPEQYKNFTFYDIKNSASKVIIKEEENYCDNFEFAYYLSDDISINDKKLRMNFFYATIVDRAVPGEIGLLYTRKHDDGHPFNDLNITFLSQLKQNKLINKYIWSVFFNKRNLDSFDEKGFLVIGDYLHELNQDFGYYKKERFNINNFITINSMTSIFGMELRFLMDEANIIKKIINKDKIFDDDNIIRNLGVEMEVEIRYDFNGIEVPSTLKNYTYEIFKDYLNKNICTFEYAFENGENQKTICCKNENGLLQELKKRTSIIAFKNTALESYFFLGPDDLFVVKNDYIFCLLFNTTLDKNKWVLGKPFLKKYQFSFDVDNKKIIYYKEDYTTPNSNSIEKESGKKGLSKTVFICSIVGASILFLVLGTFVGYKIYIRNKRKIRANELTEDVEYISDDEKKKKPILPIDE